jgi:hypothetical protein
MGQMCTETLVWKSKHHNKALVTTFVHAPVCFIPSRLKIMSKTLNGGFLRLMYPILVTQSPYHIHMLLLHIFTC